MSRAAVPDWFRGPAAIRFFDDVIGGEWPGRPLEGRNQDG